MENNSVIFDLDGTIADTLELTFQGLNRIMPDFGWTPLNRAQLENLRAMTPQQIMKQFRVSYLQLPRLIARLRAELKESISTAQPIAGMRALLNDLHKRNITLGLLTSNSQENVQAFLMGHHISYFDFIHAGTDIFGKSRMLKKIIKTERLIPERVAYVGDEVRDIAAAHSAHVSSIAVTWGFNTRAILEAQRPDYLAASPEELKEIIGQILSARRD